MGIPWSCKDLFSPASNGGSARHSAEIWTKKCFCIAAEFGWESKIVVVQANMQLIWHQLFEDTSHKLKNRQEIWISIRLSVFQFLNG